MTVVHHNNRFKMLSVTCFLVVCFGFISAEDISATFTCSFENDDCGFTNDQNSELLWERKTVTLGDNRGKFFVIENSKTGTGQVGTLLSPAFQMNVSMPGCVTFDMYLAGAAAFTLIQGSGKSAQAIYSLDTPTKVWGGVYMTVNLEGPTTQFIFEARFNNAESTDSAVIAIDHFGLELNEC